MHTSNDNTNTLFFFFKHQMRIHCHLRLPRNETTDNRCDPGFARRGDR